MMTWASFLTDEVAEGLGRAKWIAAALSGALHAIVVLAAFVQPPPPPDETSARGIDVTVELASRADEASAIVTPEPVPSSNLLLSEPAPGAPPSSTDLPEATLVPETVLSEREAVDVQPERQETKFLLPLPPDPPIEAQASATVLPPTEEPPLEKLLPAADAPPSVGAHDFAQGLPPAPTPPARPQRAQAAAVQPPAAKRVQPDAKPGGAAEAAGRSPVAALQSDQVRRKSEEDYFWQIVQKISRYRFYLQAQEVARQGLVVTRMTIARDGRLLDVSLVKSSGFPVLDVAVVQAIRQASPFAPLPAELAEQQKTFIVPVNYTRER
jgi:periplasmic protein TonB